MTSAQFFATYSTLGSSGVTGRCLHVSVKKFQDKFTSLRQVNSPNSWEKFQICFTDMYLIRFLPNFTVFCVFLWISRLCYGAKYHKPLLWAASFTLYKLATKNLHLATIFLQLVAKRRPEDFFNFEPWPGMSSVKIMTTLINEQFENWHNNMLTRILSIIRFNGGLIRS